MLFASRFLVRALLAASALAATAHVNAFVTYKSSERAKSSRTAYVPARANVDISALFGDAALGADTAKSSSAPLTLQLPSGKRYDIARARVLPGLDGGRTFVGYFKSHGEDYRVYLTDQRGIVSGMMYSPEGAIEVAPKVLEEAGAVSITSRAKAGHTTAFSFQPDAKAPPESQALTERNAWVREAGASLGIDTQAIAKAAIADQAKNAGNTTIDILVLYTQGMVTRHSNAAGVTARLNSLVSIMNDALLQSQATLTIRLIHAAQTSYADTTNNNDALDAISPGSTQAVKTQADALRTQYGADLVALVRPYNRANHAGCGVAWVLGAGGNGIQSYDKQYAFASISDGTDIAGSGYFCEDVTFAHELGHNLGLQHDRANSTTVGVTNYAYGYIDNAVQFGTIMSYFPGNRLARYSNPNTTCVGVPCGKPSTASDSANAAASIMVSMNAIAAFGTAPTTTAQVKRDVNGDGKDDLILKKDTGEVYVWFLDGATIAGGGYLGTVTADWNIVGVADVNGDGRADIVWRNSAGWVAVWLLNGMQAPTGGLLSLAGLEWQIAGLGDFNGDGKSDLLWKNANGQFAMWFLNGVGAISGGLWTYAAPEWSVLGVGDVNADGKDDVLLRHPNGNVTLWRVNGLAPPTGGQIGSIAAEWSGIGVGDVNGDGRADILWRHTLGYVAQWQLNDMAAPAGGIFASAASSLSAPIFVDSNGNGTKDIMWRVTGGLVGHWAVNGMTGPAGAFVSSLGTDWIVR